MTRHGGTSNLNQAALTACESHGKQAKQETISGSLRARPVAGAYEPPHHHLSQQLLGPRPRRQACCSRRPTLLTRGQSLGLHLLALRIERSSGGLRRRRSQARRGTFRNVTSRPGPRREQRGRGGRGHKYRPRRAC